MLLLNLLILLQEPMNIKPGDPILPITIFDLNNNSHALNQVVETTLCFIFSLECQACTEALPVVSSYFPNKHDVIFLFVDPLARVKEYTEKHPLNQNIRVFITEHEALVPYNVRTLPAILGYFHSKLQLGYYGAIDFQRAKMLEYAFEHGWSNKVDH